MSIFDRILCGVDESEASVEAVRQAASLLEPGSRLAALAVLDEALTSEAGWMATRAADQLREDLLRNVERVRAEVPAVEIEMIKGRPLPGLLERIERDRATLVAVGSHNVRRTPGIIIGSLSTALLHQAPCSVLVARQTEGLERFPGVVVVGVDGSPHAAKAFEAARAVAERTGAALHGVVATKGKDVDVESASALWSDCELEEGAPVQALVRRSKDAGLVVVGSRGLHGLKSLGSVSERVSHQAACSVLVVRS
jgi:nucleotide-binding universal stress UspA family protein